MKKLTLALVGAVVLGAALLSVHLQAGKPESPRPELVAVSKAAPRDGVRIAAEGRVVSYPGAEVVVGTDFAGTITRLLVSEKSTLRKGDLIAELNADTEKAALLEAKAHRGEAEADIRWAETEITRVEKLLAGKVGTQQAVDKARRDLEAATARRATSLAEEQRLAATIAKSRITAPLAGVVLGRHVEPGETVERGRRLVTVADLTKVRIEAEVDESDSGRVVVGAPVTIRAEGDGNVVYRGTVEEIPDSVNPRKTKPQDPGKPSDTRVLLVKIALEKVTPLKLGRRVEVEIQGRS